jgi:hypothetical protein
MNADDDGFCEHFTIMRMTESKPDDLKILQAKNFINVFDDRVLVIIDWKENNYLRADRYTPSKYLEIYKNELVGLSVGIPKVDKVATQDRLGKERLGKVRKEKVSKDKTISISENKFSQEIVNVMELFSQINPSIQYGNKTQRKACEDMFKKFGYENTIKMVKQVLGVQGNKYAPTATTPYAMYTKLGDFKVYFDKNKTESKVLDLSK